MVYVSLAAVNKEIETEPSHSSDLFVQLHGDVCHLLLNIFINLFTLPDLYNWLFAFFQLNFFEVTSKILHV
jgi:hypothetical protein